PLDIDDDRERRLRQIVQRRGQPEFRQKLLMAYGRKCAISGCTTEDALEAAHIAPYLGVKSQTIANGLLLRADLHTLFDLNLIGINPNSMKVELSERIRNSSHSEFSGKRLNQPDALSQRPSKQALKARWKTFQDCAGY